jgi:hypothetical protein
MTEKAISGKVLKGGGEYVKTLKDNHKNLDALDANIDLHFTEPS